MSTSTKPRKKTASKTKMKTVVALVLDETGSMNPTALETIGAVNSYFKTLAQETPGAVVSIMEFSDTHGEETFRPLVSAVKATDVPKLDINNYRPRGNTPLYDAIGRSIRETEKIKADRYLLIVMTDGLENASREWDLEGVKKLIEIKQGENWTIIYLGANQDAWAVGQTMGVLAGNTMSVQQSAAGVHTTSHSLAHATKAYAEGSKGSTSAFFKDAGQDASDYDPDKEKK